MWSGPRTFNSFIVSPTINADINSGAFMFTAPVPGILISYLSKIDCVILHDWPSCCNAMRCTMLTVNQITYFCNKWTFVEEYLRSKSWYRFAHRFRPRDERMARGRHREAGQLPECTNKLKTIFECLLHNETKWFYLHTIDEKIVHFHVWVICLDVTQQNARQMINTEIRHK